MPHCRLCVRYGLCTEDDDDPRWAGHETHRCYTCQVSQLYREQTAPKWLLREVAERLTTRWTLELPGDIDLYTRAMVPHPRPQLTPPPAEGTFQWVRPMPPNPGPCTYFVDGSRLYAEHALYGLLTRFGYAIAVLDADRNLVAVARGLPPPWVKCIHGAELYALLEAAGIADPGEGLFSDCRSVVDGCFRGRAWGNSQARYYACAWGPMHSTLDEGPSRVRWMPAHVSDAQSVEAAAARAARSLSDGSPLERWMVRANGAADINAKEEAKAVKPPLHDFKLVRDQAERVLGIAQWVARATVMANHWPAPESPAAGARQSFIRDSEALRPVRAAKRQPAKPPRIEAPPAAGGEDLQGTSSASDSAESTPLSLQQSGSRAPSVPTATSQRTSKLARVRRAAERAQLDADQLRLQDWVDSRPPARPQQHAAVDRMAALKARLATHAPAPA